MYTVTGRQEIFQNTFLKNTQNYHSNSQTHTNGKE